MHCFTGGFQDFKRWLQDFPNFIFGFNESLLHPKKKHHPKLIKVIVSMDLGRILLKTDALLLLQPKYYGQMRHNNMVVNIAAKIGAIRHIFLSNTRQNIICFFKLFHQIQVSTDTSRQFTSIERFMLVKTDNALAERMPDKKSSGRCIEGLYKFKRKCGNCNRTLPIPETGFPLFRDDKIP